MNYYYRYGNRDYHVQMSVYADEVFPDASGGSPAHFKGNCVVSTVLYENQPYEAELF